MDESKGEILEVLVEIRDTLNRIFVCFEDEYLEIQKRKYGEKVKAFDAILTDSRERMFPFLFDRRHLSQAEIAQAAGVTQSAVSKFISLLIENGFIEQTAEADRITYRDKYDLLKFLKK